jgi:hypothetical protein
LLQSVKLLQSCNSAILAIAAIRNTKQLAVMRPTPQHPDQLVVIVSTEPPRCHCGASRRHDGQLCHHPDWKPTAATENGLSRVRVKKRYTRSNKEKEAKRNLV